MTDKLELVDWDRYYVPKSGEFVYDTVGRGKPRNLTFGLSHQGYPTASLVCTDGERRKFFVHRLVAWKYVPLVDGKTQINHIDGVKTNNDASNLEWCTHEENHNHADLAGLRPKGERCGNKLTESVVLNARGLNRMGVSCAELARQCGVSKSTMHAAITGLTWSHL